METTAAVIVTTARSCLILDVSSFINVILCFSGCEPEESDDWSPEASCSQCSFCKLPLDKLNVSNNNVFILGHFKISFVPEC